ncbi:MAG: transglycosylase domain-containing protein, partial [Myxococcota bacterium]|nr:transglycosylase domain-containing protein [Myxococcota bacterium]
MRLLLVPLAGALVGLAVLAAAVAVPYPRDRLRPTSSLHVLDRRGQLLRQVPLPGGGRGDWVSIGEVPPVLLLVILAGEDHRFYQHCGVDLGALLRAAWLNLRAGRWAYGGSTISMQLARLLRPHQRNLVGKLQDVVDALRLERALSKQEILEQYVNRAYYGAGAIGIEAAAQRYLGRRVRDLSDGEAALLAVLPRGPVAYDPRFRLKAALARRSHILDLMLQRGEISAAQRARIEATPIVLAPPQGRTAAGPQRAPFAAPHFVDFVLASLPAEVRAVGGRVHTTLDGVLQERIEQAVRSHVQALGKHRVSQAGVVVLDPRTGGVLAMVGSADYHDEAHAGQINIITTPRHPGSALKPFTYALALEQGDTPATIAWDVAGLSPATRQRANERRQHGPVRYRVALASSYNLAALYVAERIGPARLLDRLLQAGLSTLDRPADAYGAALTLGAGPVRLLDLTAAYGFVVGGGWFHPARAVERIEPPGGPVWTMPQPAPVRLFSPEVSWLVLDMLADPSARRPAFGDDLPFDLPYPVAAKTGTSGGYSDNVAIIATSEYLVGAWAGNFDGTGMHAVLAMAGAAPLARAALRAATDGRPATLPPPPPGLVTRPICTLSGQAPGPHCPRKMERFIAGTEPQQICLWHRLDERGRLAVLWPEEARAYAERLRHAGG